MSLDTILEAKAQNLEQTLLAVNDRILSGYTHTYYNAVSDITTVVDVADVVERT